MPISRGLVISLGASVLGCSLLFLYFRNRISSIENKVNLMFDLIQNHQQPQPVIVEKDMQQNMSFSVTEKQNVDDKIQVSEDEYDVDDDNQHDDDDDAFDSDDSEEVSDTEEDNKISLSDNYNEDNNAIVLENVEQLNTETLEQTNNADINDVDSLDEINDSDIEEEIEEETVADNNEDKVSDTENKDEEEDDKTVKVEEFNYNSLKVAELKALAQERNISGYSSLKKKALIDLLKANE